MKVNLCDPHESQSCFHLRKIKREREDAINRPINMFKVWLRGHPMYL